MTEKKLFSGKVAFTLYDTYGFPLDLTQMILREKGIEVNIDEFNNAMQEQKQRSKANWVGSGDKKQNELYLQIDNKCEFVGYTKTKTNAVILKLIKNNEFVNEVSAGDNIEIVTDRTVLYGESGGQIGDSGLIVLLNKDNLSIPLPFSVIQINSTIKLPNQLIIHKGIVEMGKFRTGDYVNLTYDTEKRKRIKANHSATHLLHYALRSLLGDTVNQKGSYVDDKRLRLDISYNDHISLDTLNKVEEIVNNLIIGNTAIKTEIMNIDDAKKTGAMALFGEKYNQTVRVVSIGLTVSKDINLLNLDDKNITEALTSLSTNQQKKYCSIEFCGGTHTEKTGDIGFFKIIKEESIANGIRRIEAVTGLDALRYVNNKIEIVNSISNNFKISSDNILEKIYQLVKENKELKKQISDFEKDKVNNIIFQEKIINNTRIMHKVIDNLNVQDIKVGILNWLNGKFKENCIVVLICKNNSKNTIIVGISKNITDKYNAIAILKKLGGNGGGQIHFAMGSIENIPNNIDVILQ